MIAHEFHLWCTFAEVQWLLISAIALDLANLALPSWTLLLFLEGELVSYFHIMLWGNLISGFLRSEFPIGPSFFIVFVLVIISCLAGLLCFLLSRKNHKWTKKLSAIQTGIIGTSCVLYIVVLISTFSTSFQSLQDFWMAGPFEDSPRQLAIGIYSPFHLSFYHQFEGIFNEFLSAGFILAIVSAITSFVVYYLLKKIRV